MIRLLLRPPHFQCDTPAEAAKLARIIRISSDAPLIEVVDGESAKSKRCAKCGKSFSTVAHGDRASSNCRDCRPKPARWAANRKPRAKAAKPVPVPVAAPAPQPKTAPIFVPKHGPRRCSSCPAVVAEFELVNGQCRECAPVAALRSA